jgi:hypothetical protein
MNIDNKMCHFVYVDSVRKIAGTSSSFTYNLNLPSDMKFDRVVVLDALIPKSYYLIQSGLNTFQLQEGATTVTVTMPVGNYTFNAFKTVVAAQLTAASPNGWIYTILSPNTNAQADSGKFTYVVAGNSSQPSLIFTNQNSIYEQFGFDVNTTNVFIGNNLISTNVCKLQVEDRIYLNSNIVSGGPNVYGVLQEINGSPSPTFSSIVYQCTAPEYYSKILAVSASSSASFALSDEHGQELDLNGLSCNFTLMFYQNNDIWDRIKNFLRLVLHRPSEK